MVVASCPLPYAGKQGGGWHVPPSKQDLPLYARVIVALLATIICWDLAIVKKVFNDEGGGSHELTELW